MQTMTVEQAQSQLADLISKLPPGEEIILLSHEQPVATLRACASAEESRTFGTLKGTILYMAPDFDAIPEGFEEYLP